MYIIAFPFLPTSEVAGIYFEFRLFMKMSFVSALVDVLVVVVVSVLCGLGLACGSRFAYFCKRFLQGRHVGLVCIEGYGYCLLLHVKLNILHPLLKGDVLHDFVAAALAMQVAVEDNGLFVRLGLDSRQWQ